MQQVVATVDGADLDPDQGLMTGIALSRFVPSSANADESTRVLGGDFSNRRTDVPTKAWPRLRIHINDSSAAFADLQFTFALELLLSGVSHLGATDTAS